MHDRMDKVAEEIRTMNEEWANTASRKVLQFYQ